MTYPSIKETFYRASQSVKATRPMEVILTVPHGADADEFFRFFPEIQANPELQPIWSLFETYLAIERDVGASELAHAIAYELCHAKIEARVVEVNYPRGILDGGRLREHCLRECLPPKLFEDLKEAMLRIHDTSLSYMDRLYESMLEKRKREGTESYLLDVHTMASFCPVDEEGERATFPVSFARLEAYVDQYRNAKNRKYQRKIDLICSDEKARKLADPQLLSSIARELTAENYPCLENEPYHAAPIYLSFQHMQMVPGLSIDIPKYYVAKGDIDHELERITVDPLSIKKLSRCLARALISLAVKP